MRATLMKIRLSGVFQLENVGVIDANVDDDIYYKEHWCCGDAPYENTISHQTT